MPNTMRKAMPNKIFWQFEHWTTGAIPGREFFWGGAVKRYLIGVQRPLKRRLTASARWWCRSRPDSCHTTPANGSISACLAALWPLYHRTDLRPPQATPRALCSRTHKKKGRATSTTAVNPTSITISPPTTTPEIQAKSKQMYFSFFQGVTPISGLTRWHCEASEPIAVTQHCTFRFSAHICHRNKSWHESHQTQNMEGRQHAQI